MSEKAPTIFVSYSRYDEAWKDRLVKHLKVIEFEGAVEVWDDRRIEAGDSWLPEIKQAMERAAVAVLIVSPDFLTSRFIRAHELTRILERRSTEGLRVVPVIARPCAWQKVAVIQGIQVRPRDGRALSGGTEHQIDQDLTDITNEIHELLSARIVAGATNDAALRPKDSFSGNPYHYEGDEQFSPLLPAVSKHAEFVRELLERSEARPFLRNLIADLRRTPELKIATAADVVRHFSVDTHAGSQDQVKRLFFSVRRALRASPSIDAVRQAAASLYCLAACRLVNQAAYEKQTRESGSRYVFHTPTDHNLICAVISTALFGGRLELQLDDESRGLRGQSVFKVHVPNSGDWSSFDFERAVFAALCPNHSDLPDVMADTGKLPDDLREILVAKLDSIREVDEQPFAFVVPGVTDPAVVRLVAESHKAPVFLLSSVSREVASELLGMDPRQLKAQIDEFILDYLAKAPGAKSEAPFTRADPSPPSSVAFHVSGENVVIATGPHANAQAGTGQHIQQTQGVSLAELAPLIQELAKAVAQLPEDQRRPVQSHVAAVQTEASKGAAADAGVIKRAVETIKSVGSTISGAEKIVSLCDKLLRTAGPFLAGLGS